MKSGNGTNLLAADVIGLVNNLAHTLFKQINVRLNGTLISPQTDTYHYKAFIKTLLNNDPEDGKTILAGAGWYSHLQISDDGAGNDMTGNRFDPAHNDYKAMPEDRKNMLQSRLQFLRGK